MNVYIGGTKDYSAMQGPAPDGFHVPLSTEWQGLKTIMDGLGLTTGDNWRINLHMPFAGLRYGRSATIAYNGTYGYYWSSSAYGSDHPTFASYLLLISSDVYANNFETRSGGFTVRCFKDTFEVPTASWTVIQGTLGGAGIFWDQTDGIISITGDGTTGYTIQDKNLGATTVYNDGDALTQANMGNMYQWGNNYGFPSTGTVTTSSTKVDASSYGPGNYYNSSTFITVSTSPYDRSSVQNDNLRGGVTGIVSPVELKNAYIGEYYDGPLRFTANTAGSTVQLTKNGSPTSVTLEKSIDGTNRSTYTFGTTITLSNIGDKVYFRNTSTTTTGFSTNSDYYRFVISGTINASGDVTSLINKNCTDTLVGNYCFYGLFLDCTGLITAPNLPATTLTQSCYNNMFRRCTGLTATPSLPATTLEPECYKEMFAECSNIETLSILPATSLQPGCYNRLFRLCTKIKLSSSQTGEYQTAYRIPTTGTGTTATDAIAYMFYGTGGTFTDTPSINTTYYTSNTVV